MLGPLNGNVGLFMRLSIVIPIYNEHRRLQETFKRVSSFIAMTKDVDVEVFFVDDGSVDESVRMLQGLIISSQSTAIKLIRYAPNRGKGHAVKMGILAATGDIILMSDADLSTPLEDWRKLYVAMQAGADLICGSRAVQGAHICVPAPLARRILSRVFNVLVRLSGVHGIRDTQCGFKLFRAEPARLVFSHLKTLRFAFDVEMISVARDLGYRVDEVAVNWDYSAHSTVHIFSSGTRMLFDLLKIVVRRHLRL